jgi:hypothetical protein
MPSVAFGNLEGLVEIGAFLFWRLTTKEYFCKKIIYERIK